MEQTHGLMPSSWDPRLCKTNDVVTEVFGTAVPIILCIQHRFGHGAAPRLDQPGSRGDGDLGATRQFVSRFLFMPALGWARQECI